MIKEGADINATDDCHNTALMNFIERDHLVASRVLMGKGANLNIPNMKGNTALNLAIDQNWQPFVREMIERGADVNAASHEGIVPIMRAKLWWGEKVAKELFSFINKDS